MYLHSITPSLLQTLHLGLNGQDVPRKCDNNVIKCERKLRRSRASTSTSSGRRHFDSGSFESKMFWKAEPWGDKGFLFHYITKCTRQLDSPTKGLDPVKNHNLNVLLSQDSLNSWWLHKQSEESFWGEWAQSSTLSWAKMDFHCQVTGTKRNW